MSIFSLVQFVFVQMVFPLVIVFGISIFIFLVGRKLYTGKAALVISALFLGISTIFLWGFIVPGPTKTFGPAGGPVIPLRNILEFFRKSSSMERIADIARDPNDVPPLLTRLSEDRVKIELETREVIGIMADGVEFNYWTFNGTVPGPFLRIREGDTVELTLKNSPTSIHNHNIDLHAVTGPGGGATVTNIKPGESKTLTFKALNSGLYVYHCAHPNVSTHMAHGMYGLILVEPKEGMARFDKEFYVMQGEFYSTGKLGKSGLQIFDAQKMIDGEPEYIVLNGRVNGAVGTMKAKTGDRVRIYVGNGGVNLVSSFHVIGEIFDRVYPEGAMGAGSAIFRNVQTTVVPAGGAAIVEFVVDVPGKYILVDHALARLDRGAWGTLEVAGEEKPDIFHGSADSSFHGH